MSNSREQDRAAIQVVARHFSAAEWNRPKAGPPGPHLTIEGKRITVDVEVLREKGLARYAGSKGPRLRFDRVALRLIRDLQASLRESVPDDRTLVVTVTAPIRLASKTAAVLQAGIRDRLARHTGRLELEEMINGNQVTARLVKDVGRQASKVVAFVHNPDPDHAALLVRIAESLLRHTGAAASRRATVTSAGDRWLALACDDGFAHAETYRQVCSQLALATPYRKILLVSAGGVDVLAG